MIPPDPFAPLVHGGDLDAARRLFPGAPEPFLDLSTGINPNPYPIPELPPEKFARLPDRNSLARLSSCAAAFHGAPSESNVVPAPGTQILVSLTAALSTPGRAAVLGPTYAEHARAAAASGYDVASVGCLDDLGNADLAVVVNPNNPDGRIVSCQSLRALASELREHGGTLVVDEAFMEVGPLEESFAPHVEGTNVIVLRSFGKFFGLAGLRLGFALAASENAARLRAGLGPWPVSGPALAIGCQALSDTQWIERTRHALKQAAQRLDALLAGAGLEPVGGTPLFRLVRSADGPRIFERLGRAGILVRRFEHEPAWLRFGIPGTEQDWQRLEAALRN
jgi:cobalamin biosynthesis protein CobC